MDDTAAYEAEQAYREALHQMNQECEDCEVKAQLAAAEEVIELCKTNLVSIASMTVFDGGTEESYGICYDHAVETAEHTLERIGTYRNTYGEVE